MLQEIRILCEKLVQDWQTQFPKLIFLRNSDRLTLYVMTMSHLQRLHFSANADNSMNYFVIN